MGKNGRKLAKHKNKTGDFLSSCDTIVNSLCSKGVALMDETEYDGIKMSLEALLRKHYDTVKVYFFGSRFIGLANDNSDLDIFVDIGKF